jgi:hypothetical protein
VACHFAGETGQHPARPVTANVLGIDDQGNPDPTAGPSELRLKKPGFDDTWYDLATQTMGERTGGSQTVGGR